MKAADMTLHKHELQRYTAENQYEIVVTTDMILLVFIETRYNTGTNRLMRLSSTSEITGSS